MSKVHYSPFIVCYHEFSSMFGEFPEIFYIAIDIIFKGVKPLLCDNIDAYNHYKVIQLLVYDIVSKVTNIFKRIVE